MRLKESRRMRGYPRTLVRTGLVYNTPVKPEQPDSYFDDTHYYELKDSESRVLGDVAARLFQAYIVGGDWVIKHNLFAKFHIPKYAVPAILDTWEDEKAGRYAPSVYGRFDLRPTLTTERGIRRRGRRVYHRPSRANRKRVITGARLLEFNADTPTSLVETGHSQWVWFKDARKCRRMRRLGHTDQWNDLHKALIKRWMSEVVAFRARTGRDLSLIHFAYTSEEKEGEDLMTAAYMQVLADEASRRLIAKGEPGFRTKLITMEQIKQHSYDDPPLDLDEVTPAISLSKDHTVCLGSFTAKGFTFDETPSFDTITDADFYDGDPAGTERIQMCFKLYAWEHILWEKFGPQLLKNTLKPDGTVWVEQAYKLLWSNKAMLAILWEIFGDPTTVHQKLEDAGIKLDDYTEWLGDPTTIHELLLPAYFEGEQPKGFERNCARKPLLGREGADVHLIQGGAPLVNGELQGYGEEGFVLQELAVLESFHRDGVPFYPVAGVWMVVDKAVALCFRHDSHPVTGNLSRFCPHILRMGK